MLYAHIECMCERNCNCFNDGMGSMFSCINTHYSRMSSSCGGHKHIATFQLRQISITNLYHNLLTSDNHNHIHRVPIAIYQPRVTLTPTSITSFRPSFISTHNHTHSRHVPNHQAPNNQHWMLSPQGSPMRLA